ncbi:MAG: flagellar protein FlaG [Thermosediminibacterales bacterium]|nr:flagellar protein FlaG [Thermosediminibacterales bacterium]MDK2836208.1 flagellar protein FlaG [Thermosediminibacterales bacterium]
MKVQAVDSIKPLLPMKLSHKSVTAAHQRTVKTNKNEENTQTINEKNTKATEERVIKAIEKANTSLELAQTRFEFSIHEKTHEIIVRVYNKETDELIREIPPEKILDLVAKIWEMAGIIIDERV